MNPDFSEEDFEDNIERVNTDSISGGSSTQIDDGSINFENAENSDNQQYITKQKRTRSFTDSATKKKKANKRKKKSDTAELVNAIRELKESMEKNTDKETSVLHEIFGDRPGCSIKEVMEDVLRLPQVDSGSEIHFFSMLLLGEKSTREMYNTMKDEKFRWLEYCHDRFLKGLWKPSSEKTKFIPFIF